MDSLESLTQALLGLPSRKRKAIAEANRRIERDFEIERDSIEERGAQHIYRKLHEDYRVLEERSDYALNKVYSEGIDKDTLAKAEDLVNMANNASGLKPMIEEVLKLGGDERIYNAFLLLDRIRHSNKTYTERNITSYIGTPKSVEGESIIIIPSKSIENAPELSKSIDDKVSGVLDIREICKGFDRGTLLERRGDIEVNGVRKLSIGYEIEKKISPQGFVYFIAKSPDLKCFETNLREKLSLKEIQPAGFEEAKLYHDLERVSYEFLRSLINSQLEEPLSYKSENVEIVGTQGQSLNTILNFNTENPEEAREIAKKRLGGFGDTLKTAEVAQVLGVTPEAVGLGFREGRYKALHYHGRRGIIFGRDEVGRIINEYLPSRRGWMSKP